MQQGIQQLRERRTAKAQEARKLLDDHTGDKWTSEISNRVDVLYNEIDALDDQVAKHERAIAADAHEGVRPDKVKDSYDPKDPANIGRVLFNKFIRGGDKALSAEDWATYRNTMSTTTGSEGGFTVPSLISAQIFDIMKAYGAMRAVADIIPTTDGKPLSFPTSDGTAETGEWIAQNTTATAADPTFGTKSLNVFKASSKIVAVPFELLQDAIIDVSGETGGGQVEIGTDNSISEQKPEEIPWEDYVPETKPDEMPQVQNAKAVVVDHGAQVIADATGDEGDGGVEGGVGGDGPEALGVQGQEVLEALEGVDGGEAQGVEEEDGRGVGLPAHLLVARDAGRPADQALHRAQHEVKTARPPGEDAGEVPAQRLDGEGEQGEEEEGLEQTVQGHWNHSGLRRAARR